MMRVESFYLSCWNGNSQSRMIGSWNHNLFFTSLIQVLIGTGVAGGLNLVGV